MARPMSTDATSLRAVASFDEAWQAWHDARLEFLLAPYGVLSRQALHPLGSEPQRLAGVSGVWWSTDESVIVQASSEDDLRLDGRLLDGRVEFRAPESTGRLMHGDVLVEPLVSTSATDAEHAVLLRSPHAPALTDFGGIPTYPVSRRWAVAGRYEPYATPRLVSLAAANAGGGVRREQAIVGRLLFTLEGCEYALEPYGHSGGRGGRATWRDRDRLNVPFRDQTSGVTTYGGGRVVFVEAEEGQEFDLTTPFDCTIDFNRAINPPCALSSLATCTLPPPGNTLALRVQAGEKLPTPATQPQ